MKEYVKKIKRHLKEVVKTKTSDESIALGFAIGTFIAILPTYGFTILLGLIIVLMFKKISKISLFIALAFWNPLVLAPLYMLSYRIGDYLFGTSIVLIQDITTMEKIFNFSRRFLISNFIISVLLSFASYFAVKIILRLYKEK